MEENRGYFRVQNQQAIKAKYQNNLIRVAEISASGMKLNTNDSSFVKQGYIDIIINYNSKAIKIEFFTLSMEYELLRQEEDFIILVFTNETQKMNLASVLKKIATDKSILSKTYY